MRSDLYRIIILFLPYLFSCSSSTQEEVITDTTAPSLSNVEIKAFRFNAQLAFEVDDDLSEKVFVDIYLNEDLLTSIEADTTSNKVISYNIENLKEGTSYSLRIEAFDESGNALSPVTSTLRTNGAVFTGDLYFTKQLEVEEFGMFQYEEIEGDLIVDISGRRITNLDALNDIKAVRGDVSIKSNGLMPDPFSGLANVDSISGSLHVYFINPMRLLDKVSYVGWTLVLFNLAENNEPFLPNLAQVKKGVSIVDLIYTKDFQGLNSLETIDEGSLYVQSSALRNLDFLQSLTTVGGNIFIESNMSLRNLDGLQGLSDVSGNISIASNVNLSDFCGLTTLIDNGFNNEWSVNSNSYNPSMDEIEAGACSL